MPHVLERLVQLAHIAPHRVAKSGQEFRRMLPNTYRSWHPMADCTGRLTMFYSDAVRAAGEAAAKKVALLRENPAGYFVASMLAGAYVGVGVFLVFAVGGPMAAAGSPWTKILMGGSFAVALSLVVFAGAELFTGNNLIMAIGCWRRRTHAGHLMSIWFLSWLGNLAGAALLAVLLFYAGILNPDPQFAAVTQLQPGLSAQHAGYVLVQQFSEKKMQLDWLPLLMRGILCNWLVCLGVWCTSRMTSESGKLIMIFWCLYAFVASGFEHSVANMTLFSLALLQPHGAAVSLGGAGWNLLWVSVGNAIGGAVLVGAAYWAAAHRARRECTLEAKVPAEV